MPIVVDCASGASRLIYEMSLHPKAFGYSGFAVIHGVDPIEDVGPIWRAVPAARFSTGRVGSVTSQRRADRRDGTLYGEDESAADVPAVALQ